MTSKEALEKLYEEREFAYADKFNHKSKTWSDDIKHCDNIGISLKTIEKDLEVLEIIKERKIDVEDIINATNYLELYRAYCRGEVSANEHMCSVEAFKEFKLLSEWLGFEDLLDENDTLI